MTDDDSSVFFFALRAFEFGFLGFMVATAAYLSASKFARLLVEIVGSFRSASWTNLTKQKHAATVQTLFVLYVLLLALVGWCAFQLDVDARYRIDFIVGTCVDGAFYMLLIVLLPAILRRQARRKALRVETARAQAHDTPQQTTKLSRLQLIATFFGVGATGVTLWWVLQPWTDVPSGCAMLAVFYLITALYSYALGAFITDERSRESPYSEQKRYFEKHGTNGRNPWTGELLDANRVPVTPTDPANRSY